MKNILVAIDIDERTHRLVDYAVKLAKPFGAKIWIVHVAAPDPDFVGFKVGPKYIRDFRAEELREEHRQLQKLARRVGEEGVESDALLIQGSRVEMILDEARQLNVDMIIAGAHEHGFLHDAFVGNTALRLFKQSRIPLLTVPIDEEEG